LVRKKRARLGVRETASEGRVHAALTKALLGGRLRPGTPLRERSVAELFGVTRGAVRKVLLQLVHEGKLETFANRGAYVPRPTVTDIRMIYEARRAVEAGLVAVLAERITAPQIAQLKAHVGQERRAQRRGQRDEQVKLAGGFHAALAALAANEALSEIVDRLVARTQLCVALFESDRHSGCAPEEHWPIVEALSKKDGARGAAAMVTHLRQVEARVVAQATEEELEEADATLKDILGEELEEP
jgi:DNA-binding GntR family transcriptional regulator